MFSPRMRINGYFGGFQSKTWHHHWLRRPRFPISQTHSTTGLRLRDIIWCVSYYHTAWPCDLDLSTFDLNIDSYTVPRYMPDTHTHPNFDYLWNTEFYHIFLEVTVIAHAPRHLTYHPLTNIIRIFEIHDPNLIIHFVTFGALRHWRNIAFLPL